MLSIQTKLRHRLQQQRRQLDELEAIAHQHHKPPAWGREWGLKFLPHYFASEPADFHGPLFEQLGELHTKRNVKAAIIAPRESGKSTFITLTYVFDDVENNAVIASAAERTSTWRWATREVVPAGSASTIFISVGSALHRECVAVRLGQLPGWTGFTHQAIHQWPERMDLWEEWERQATNLADPNRNRSASEFYAANRATMDAGAKVYWPARWPLHELMKRRAEIGSAGFNCEYQGIPSTEGLTEWPAEFFDRPQVWFDHWPDLLIHRVQSLDPSKGADSKSGDYQAHILLGLDESGTMYVEAVLAREPIGAMIARALDLAKGFGPLTSLVVEANDTLGMLSDEFESQIRASGRVIPLQTMTQTVNKIIRIRRLGVYFGRLQIRFRNTTGTRLLVDQLRDFPGAEHDHGPDALQLAMSRLEMLTNQQ